MLSPEPQTLYPIKVVDTYPDGAGHIDADGRLPLHPAVACGATAQVVQVLVDAYPEGAMLQDKVSANG